MAGDDLKSTVLVEFCGPGCWIWCTEDGDDGVAATEEAAVAAARAALEAGRD